MTYVTSAHKKLNLDKFIYQLIQYLIMILEELLLINTTVLIILVIWSVIWKGIALWKCGRQNQLTWFVFILIFNTAGILPIIYLLFFQKSKRAAKKKKK